MSNQQINYADIEDKVQDKTKPYQQQNMHARPEGGQTIFDDYTQLGAFLDPTTWHRYLELIADASNRFAGAGSRGNILQNFLSRLDRHGTAWVPLNTMNSGYTFITRPRLNLTGGNLLHNPILNTLYTTDENSIPFMIRALLDTKLCNGRPLFRGQNATYDAINPETDEFARLAVKSGLLDVANPFFTPLCNGLKSISGFPDFTIQEETTEGDFHSGDYTFVKGGDMNNRTQELSLDFRDVQGSVIMAIFYYWLLYMALQTKGVLMAYPDDVYEQRLNYTVSIYRFIMDPSRRNILWWCKATGCFPKSVPTGAIFNINQGEPTISSAMNFSIPFVANDVKVNDPGALMDFNKLMRNYNPYITNPDYYAPVTDDQAGAAYNFIGLPYIVTDRTGLRLRWYTSNRYSDVLPLQQDNVEEIKKARESVMETRERTMQEAGEKLNLMDLQAAEDLINEPWV